MSSASQPTTPDGQTLQKGWTNPFPEGSWLQEEYEEVVSEERDMIIIVDDHYARRGTGKTVASLQLAAAMDQTEAGMRPTKATLNPEELENAYTSEEPRSGLVLDEGEYGASNRDPMSSTNKALRKITSMGRVEQKYLVINTPVKRFIDSDLQRLSVAWISMVRRGLALVHELKWEAYSEQLLTPAKHWLEFDDIQRGTKLRDIYNQLTQDKRAKMRGEDGGGFIPMGEHEEKIQKAEKQAKRQERNRIIRNIFDHPEFQQLPITRSMVGDVVDLSGQQVGNIVNDS